MSKVDSKFALKVQDMFSTKSLFKQCVHKDTFQYITVKSNKEVMILQSVIEDYKWSLRASGYHRQVTFTVIKDLIKNKISLAGFELSTPKDIVHYIRAEHGLRISYQKALLAREAVLNEIRGSPEDSYKMILQFAYIWNSTTQRIIDDRNEVVIVSDRHKSICKAMEVVFPNVGHCMCLVHLLRNLKLKYKIIVDTVFHACEKAFNIVDFKHEMRLLESSVPSIREELESIGFAKWSRAYSPRRIYNVMTTNISESLNSVMLKARELPICLMLKVLRMMLQREFFE
ncbi:protein FAR1-RELATED SEQUENCE 3-like [Cucumis melo var. makuwa]|uniref:Protein FAR1-RELATED SEQUENCE 3-like n=1 Tax=Cucumis melo var. makuwa TaxID=1194695 RepID=A0A5A7UA41_CUCMM|nr:protein FAR1-RELATED SEQUENCE 3-like [Cucumis melo var. makuwa]